MSENLIISHSAQETLDIARNFAHGLSAGDVVLLDGDLGSGKTHFVKGMALGLGGNADSVNSPSFSIVQSYEAKIPIYHFDFYRIKSPQEALDLGLDDYLFGDGICAIEWPEKIKKLWPDSYYLVTIGTREPDKRVISIDKFD